MILEVAGDDAYMQPEAFRATKGMLWKIAWKWNTALEKKCRHDTLT